MNEEKVRGSKSAVIEASRPREELLSRVKDIESRELTLENLDTFADEVIDDLEKVIAEAIAIYRAAHPEDNRTGKELEEAAFNDQKLGDIEKLLMSAARKRNNMLEVAQYLEANVSFVDDVLVPPDTKEISTGSGTGFKETETRPRLKALLFLLRERGITLKKGDIIAGKINPEMKRRKSYIAVTIGDLNRTVLLCDELGNKTYIFDNQKLGSHTIFELTSMGKDELDALILRERGIGTHFREGKNWIAQVEEALGVEELEYKVDEDLAEDAENLEKVPHVENGELSPWRGFWTDPATGKHWGTHNVLARFFGVKPQVLEYKKYRDSQPSIEVRSIRSGIKPAYCLEDLPFFEEYMQVRRLPRVEVEGEWAGFWTDPATGKHWGTMGALGDYFDIQFPGFFRRQPETNLPTIKILNKSRAPEKAYCLEDLPFYNELMERRELPRVETTGEWAGFWTDSDDKHWGTTLALANYFGINASTRFGERLKSLNEEGVIQSRDVMDKRHNVNPAYCLEELPFREEYLTRKELPRAETSGEWTGFWIDSDTGKHWGAAKTLARYFSVDQSSILRRLEVAKPEEKTIMYKGNAVQMYCLEELPFRGELEGKLKLPEINEEEPWKGFWVDPDTQLHWGSKNAIAKYLGVTWGTIDRRLDELEKEGRTKQVRSNSTEVTAFCLEDVFAYLNKSQK